MRKFNSIICSVIAVAFVFAFMPLLTACDGTDKYNDFAAKYDTYVKTNTDMFDANGEIKIKYKDDVAAVINKPNPTVNDKMARFTRLTGNLDSNQAIYEPIIRASLLYVNTYINKCEEFNISSKDADKLSNKFDTFKSKVANFKSQRTYLEDNSDRLTTGSETENNNLVNVLSTLYDVVVAANDFSYTFMNFYEKALTQLDDYDATVLQGQTERLYLRDLVYACDTYVKVYLPLIHDSKAVMTPNENDELYTSYGYSRFVNDLLSTYLDNRNKIRSFDNQTAGTNVAALDFIQYVAEYDPLYQKSCRVMNLMAKEWKSTKSTAIADEYNGQDSTVKVKSILGFVSEADLDCDIMRKLLQKFTTLI